MIRAYNKPFVKIDDMLSILQIPQMTFYGWLNETEVPYTLIKNKNIYVEKLAFGQIIRMHGTEEMFKTWRRQIQFENAGRSLTKSEKIRVAASQQWKCARCKQLLTHTFEVDHLEEWCLRHSDVSLQALCPNCHRHKGYDSINVGNCFFGKESLENLEKDECNWEKNNKKSDTQTNVFSKYFHPT